MDKNTAIGFLRQYMRDHARELGIREMGIFGSVASGRANAGSDVDVVVDLDSPQYGRLARIKADLDAIFGVSVDIVRKRKGMNPLLRRSIEEDAVYA